MSSSRRAQQRRPRRAGMTLLEVVLAISLAVGVVGSAMAFYRHAMDVRARLETEVRAIEAVRLIMDRMTNELRSATMAGFIGMGLEGGASEMQFVRAALPGMAAWAVRKSTEDAIPPEQDVQIVGYRLATHEDEESGQIVVDGVERTWQGILAMETPDEEEMPALPALISPDIKFLAFRYREGGNWLESWTGGDVPFAVEIVMGLDPLPEGMEAEEYPYPCFRRVVCIPAARAGRSEAVTGVDR